MLQYEFVKDEIGIRAESLSYFTLFSILPLLAGAFLFVSFFSQWAPVQAGFQGLIERFLSPIPDDYRDDLMDFVVQFKDDYLQKISQNSSSLGIFAFIVLVWIGAKVYFNIENLMNRIWNTDERRSWIERIQNFILCGVIAPVAGVAVITLPTILKSATDIEVGIWWEQGLPLIIVFLSLTFVFKFFPNTRVKWKSALGGSIAGMLMFGAANSLLQIYFRFGTNTAYGKMAAVPLLALFIYVFWMIFILGAELSFLIQHPHVFENRQEGADIEKTVLGNP
ncbi:MAG: YihY/virulence factor BrkB family protein [Bdellovibrionales bacterium]|nr:YihY/virulence factor BrkB family protein [Bdellovibrionales bacterium]